MTFTVGSLVKARGREWVVLPDSTADLLILRPLGGSDDEMAGIYLPLESVTPATFDLPDPVQVGDYRSARLLRDAVRLGFRSSAGPFRSFARLGFEPRPYQLVPLLMALKLDPVRLLIADDVGIGKTIEAGLVARELLDRGEIRRLAVLCPPPLAEQWQGELRDKFHIEAELVLASTAARLERNLNVGESLFDHHPYVIVSMDYIKSDHHREEFLRACPEFVIVDEAHTCAYGAERGGRHQRFDLVRDLARDPDRHILLVTATPHSGKEDAFRSLLTFLDRYFTELPDDLTGEENLRHRKRLAQHFIQRRRADIKSYLQSETPFPNREDAEDTYKLSPEYRRLFDRVLEYAREAVSDRSGGELHQRVRWWSALALLRSLASSPAAAAATLRNRAGSAEAETPEAADEIGRRSVLDLVDDESAEGADVLPGADPGSAEADAERNHRRLMEMARQADELQGDRDEKMKKAVTLVKDLLTQGCNPIVFCRFIPTAEYLAAELRRRLPKGVEVVAVTGLLPPAERGERVQQMAAARQRVLVATDCLSEGINLQENFNAILHYDLSWNPTRHEQREGRIDRYGQPSARVRVLTYYGLDNQIDGVVLDVLLRKHRTIRSSLGISVPVPVNTEQVVEAIFEGLLLKSKPSALQGFLPGFDEYIRPQKDDLYGKWEAATEREKRSRTLFAQETIKVDEVAQELHAVQSAIGSGVDVADFTRRSLTAFGAEAVGGEPLKVKLDEASTALREGLVQVLGVKNGSQHAFRFSQPVQPGEHYLARTHPVVEALANHVLETALDPLAGDAAKYPAARRCGAIRTRQVTTRTTLLVVRMRYHIVVKQGDAEKPLLAEDTLVAAFAGSPQNAEWLDDAAAEALLTANPDANINPEQAGDFVRKVIDGFDAIRPHLEEMAHQRGEVLLSSHQRVRRASRVRNVQYRVEPQLPPDVLGIFVYLPSDIK
ncbi:MAG TPA: helicase-related protein [Anaerolineaceae bacterium]|nr:helicase-related protein [Anaerolineaceae bacterium]HQH85548.1 helicase-related protein [Anaerolineaceae bacterium]